ncbi:MAG: GAF domain-containing protein [Anaerolineales bacterium]|nr:GAF domain-containing protein [Anaerolineales bacterium]
MSEHNKRKAQLIGELELLRQRVVELEGLVETYSGGAPVLPAELRPGSSLAEPQGSADSLHQKIEQIEQTLARRVEEMTTLYEISLNITGELGKDDLLQNIVEQAAKLLGTSMGQIHLLHPDQQHLELIASYSNHENKYDFNLLVGEGVTGQVVTTGQPIVIANYEQWPGRLENLSVKVGRIMGVPLKRGRKIIGVLKVFDGPEKQGAFDAEDVKLLNMLAAQVAIVLENSQLYRKMEARVKELATLNSVSQAINSTLDLQETLTRITDQIALQLDAAAVSVGLYDPDQHEIWFAAASGQGSDFVINKRLVMGQGIMGWVVQHSQSVLIPDASQDPRFYEEFDKAQGDFITKSILCVPLQARGQTIGVVAALNRIHRSTFNEDDLQLLNLIAAPAAAAIDNSRLYAQSQQKIKELQAAETELAQRARQLELINDIGRQIASELELDLLLERTAQLVQQTFDYHHVALFLIEEGQLKLNAVAGSYQAYFPTGHTQSLGTGIIGWVARNGQRLVANDVTQESHYTTVIKEHTMTQSELCLPIKVTGQTVGVIDIQSAALNAFTDNDIIAMEALANQVAVAVRNARLYQQARQEITERKQVEQNLRESEERFRQVITSISDHIYVSEVSPSGERVNYYHSPNIEILTGYPPTRFASDWHFWPSTLIHPDDRFRAAAQASKLGKGQSSEVEYRLMRADGAIIWVRDSARVEVKGQRKTIYGVVADITERKQREHELEIIVAIADALRTAASRTEIVMVALDKLLDLLQMEGTALAIYDPDSKQTVIEYGRGVWAGLTEKQILSRHQEQGYLFADGHLYVNNDIQNDPELTWPAEFKLINAVASITLSIQNERIGSLLVGHRHQITAEVASLLATIGNMVANAFRRASLFEALQQSNEELAQERALLAQRVEERTAELRAANAELARAARLKDEFMANMSHELRTPLNAILGMSEILRSNVYGELNSEQISAVYHIEEGGTHLLSLINDILDLSKIEAGKLDLLLSPVSVPAVCQTSLQFVKQLIHKKDMKVVYSYDNSVEVITADERRLKQILVNLLTNAVKFTPEGGRLGLEVEGDMALGVVHFTIWDTGIGISGEDMGRLFKPFVQIDSGLTRQQDGTGLGLSLVYRLTEMHGGSVKLESAVNQGSRFTVSLPWLPAFTDQTSDPLADKPRESGLPPITVLLAEDNESTIITAQAGLQHYGYQVVIARDGIEAVTLAAEIQPDLILMDIQMPGINGIEAIHQIRQNYRHLASTPIIALTALAMPHDRQRCLNAGANEYVCKPVSPSNLASLIKSQLDDKNQPQKSR